MTDEDERTAAPKSRPKAARPKAIRPKAQPIASARTPKAAASEPSPASTKPTSAGSNVGPDASSRLSSADYMVAFSPRNVAVGLAIVAGLVAIVLRRRGRKRPDG